MADAANDVDDFEVVVIPENDHKVRVLNNLLANLDLQSENLAVDQGTPLNNKQVQNNAGGYVYRVSDETRVRRFLIIGSEGGSYYCSEKELTIDNVKGLVQIIDQGKGALILKELLEISRSGRAAKQQPTLFALALCARYCPDDYKAKIKAAATAEDKRRLEYMDRLHHAAYQALPLVARISTHLFLFAKYCEMISKATKKGADKSSTGWSRQHRRAIADWYLNCDPQKLCMQVTKYRSREGWSHRDLLRLAHPTPITPEHQAVFAYIIKGIDGLRKRKSETPDAELGEPAKKVFSFLEAVDDLSALKEPVEAPKAVKLIRDFNLCREQVPNTLLNEQQIWRALMAKEMPMTAMMRNLNKMTLMGILTDGSHETEQVVKLLNDADKLKSARIHPFNVLSSWITYRAGRGARGKLTWEPVPKIVAALESAFNKSFEFVTPTNKRWCIALDVSGSMGANIMNSVVSCRDAAAAMSLVTCKTEKQTQMVAFSDKLVEMDADKVKLGGLEELGNMMDAIPMGSTDCALPMIWAKEKKLEFDVFVVYTDNETWFGNIHPSQALREYRKAMNKPEARLIVVGMTATEFTIADPDDAGMLDITGFDSAAPSVMAEFVLGNI